MPMTGEFCWETFACTPKLTVSAKAIVLLRIVRSYRLKLNPRLDSSAHLDMCNNVFVRAGFLLSSWPPDLFDSVPFFSPWEGSLSVGYIEVLNL